MMRRFSSSVVRSTSVTCSVHVLPTTVQTGVCASSSALMLASSSGLPPTRQVDPKAAILACCHGMSLRALEELGVFRIRAGPAAFDEGHAQFVELLRDAQLVRRTTARCLRVECRRAVWCRKFGS